MNRLLVALLLSGAVLDAQRLEPMRRSYPAQLVRAVDGDTYVLDVRLPVDGWPFEVETVTVRVPIRLEGLDAPEMPTDLGQRAKEAAETLLREAVAIKIEPSGARSFARWISRVYIDGKDVADVLRANGHVKE